MTSTSQAPAALDVQAARQNMAGALSLEGFATEDGLPLCPSCLKAEKGRATIHEDGGFKCHGCGFYTQNAVDFLTLPRVRHGGKIVGQLQSDDGSVVVVRPRRKTDEPASFPKREVELEGGLWSFQSATKALLGHSVPHPEGKTPRHAVSAQNKATAEPNPELYNRVLELGSVDAAKAFYGRWHISPQAVESFRVVVVTDQREFVKKLRQDFTPDDLIAAGLATPEGHLLVNARYPVVEPFILPDGRVAGLQFRASAETEAQISAHKRYKKERDAALARGDKFHGEKVPYTPKFLSLIGTSLAQRCGFGLNIIQHHLDSGDPKRRKRVDVVEGMKDALADTTFGHVAYGLPGAGVLPSRAVCNILAQFEQVHVVLDGDTAGAAGRAALLEHFAKFGINAINHPPPEGMDVTDVLVARAEKRQVD